MSFSPTPEYFSHLNKRIIPLVYIDGQEISPDSIVSFTIFNSVLNINSPTFIGPLTVPEATITIKNGATYMGSSLEIAYMLRTDTTPGTYETSDPEALFAGVIKQELPNYREHTVQYVAYSYYHELEEGRAYLGAAMTGVTTSRILSALTQRQSQGDDTYWDYFISNDDYGDTLQKLSLAKLNGYAYGMSGLKTFYIWDTNYTWLYTDRDSVISIKRRVSSTVDIKNYNIDSLGATYQVKPDNTSSTVLLNTTVELPGTTGFTMASYVGEPSALSFTRTNAFLQIAGSGSFELSLCSPVFVASWSDNLFKEAYLSSSGNYQEYMQYLSQSIHPSNNGALNCLYDVELYLDLTIEVGDCIAVSSSGLASQRIEIVGTVVSQTIEYSDTIKQRIVLFAPGMINNGYN